MSLQHVARFIGRAVDGRAKDASLLGGKGANLAEMASLGIPVPPGFTLTTNVCRYATANPGQWPDGLREEVQAALADMGAVTGAMLGSATAPLLLSVRSGAPVSMPGMMDTVLNLGLNDETVLGLAAQTGNARFAWDCYRRFIAMYAEIVLGVGAAGEHDDSPFEVMLDARKRQRRVTRDADLTADDLRELVAEYRAEVKRQTGADFPTNVDEQLWGAIAAVFRSWGNARAQTYRAMHGIPHSIGTAVTVQAMVFGNTGDDSGTGVAFTRNPATGAMGLFGEFLVNAQGEDVVAGTRTPQPIAEMAKAFPDAHQALLDVSEKLEAHFREVQDVEFTVQRGTLWMLQTRTGKRSGKAMVKIAVDLVREGLLTKAQSLARIEAHKLDEVLHPTIDPAHRPPSVARGLPASPGAAIGKVAFTATVAAEMAARGETPMLVRTETSPEDIVGMKAAAGILTARGGMTSHAAVVARGMGKPCVSACTSLRVDSARGRATLLHDGKELVISAGDIITIDGTTGEVFLGSLPLAPAQMTDDLVQLMEWVDATRKLRVRTNADTAADAKTARAFGAEGIGLCRTEHMFFAHDRILSMRKMILAETKEARSRALAELAPMQRADFEAIFRVMDGLPVTIRLLDPPLHEFLPHGDRELAELAAATGLSAAAVATRVAALSENNPMLGHRGCRLAVTYPEIYEMQARAIAEAALAAEAAGVKVLPEIMIPLVMVPGELERLRALVVAIVENVKHAQRSSLQFAVGTMIELPRACLAAGDIASYADFFSFGTNDLTQTTMGLSRDDAGTFLPAYVDQGLLERDPFISLDESGVGELVTMAVNRGRAKKPSLKIGVCGEHGGDHASVHAFHRAGLDYVSCSPFRVPIARLAAAQAALEDL